jgi:hypothetical protein
MRFFLAALLVAVLGATPITAAAQTNCTTTTLSNSYSFTSCSSDGSSSTTVCLSNSYCTTTVNPAPPVYVPPPAPPPPVSIYVPPPPVDEGITVNLDTGGQSYLTKGTFVKIGDAPAIYWVYGGQLHAFSTWPQFLNAGGRSDLSNVTRFSYLRDSTGGLFGLPVPN